MLEQKIKRLKDYDGPQFRFASLPTVVDLALPNSAVPIASLIPLRFIKPTID